MIVKLLDLKLILENLEDYKDPVIRAVAADALDVVKELIDRELPDEDELQEMGVK